MVGAATAASLAAIGHRVSIVEISPERRRLLAAFLDANPLPVPASATLLQEVGILASSGVYAQPWLHENPTGRFRPKTQVRWFAAACAFAHRFGFRGISFNSFFLTSPILAVDDPAHPQLIQPEGAAAIRACFAES